MNVLCNAEFSEWHRNDLTAFIEFIELLIKDEHQPEIVLMCFNPIQVICLCCEFLMQIGEAISAFAHKGETLTVELLALGEQIVACETLDEPDAVEKIFMESDFKDRTVLKLIVAYGFEPLLKDDRVMVLLNQLWVGKPQEMCNGMPTDYSMLSFISSAPIKCLPGQDIEMNSILSNKYGIGYSDQCFTFQYNFRRSSIQMIFKKELISTLFVSCVMIILNMSYLTNMNFALYSPGIKNIVILTNMTKNDTYWNEHLDLKNSPTFAESSLALERKPYFFTDKSALPELLKKEKKLLDDKLEKNIRDYMHKNSYSMITSSSMLFYVITKSIFNMYAELPIPMDRWSVIDIFCAFTNIFCLTLMHTLSKEDVIDEAKKMKYNILMLMTVFATWSRVVGIALVVPQFSELLMTIYAMLGSATTFLFIVMYYLLMMSVLCLALYQEAVPSYSSFIYILRTMFDAMMGAYSYELFPKYVSLMEE